MAGISLRALKSNYAENKFKYNGIEKEDGLGIEIYDAQLRELDPQIGRWWQIDPKTENMEMWSPYASNYDNPIRFFIRFIDLLHQDFLNNPKQWENDTLDRFLYALGAYAKDVQGYYDNMKTGINADEPNWQTFADILLGARIMSKRTINWTGKIIVKALIPF